ncbi:hypothetical protein LINPERHAP1_LOCUS33544 [Linum perenne]
MNPDKAPGPNCFNPGFLSKILANCWGGGHCQLSTVAANGEATFHSGDDGGTLAKM